MACLQEGGVVVGLVAAVEEGVARGQVRLVVGGLLQREVVHDLSSLCGNRLLQGSVKFSNDEPQGSPQKLSEMSLI